MKSNVWKIRLIVIGLIIGFLGILFAMISFSLGLFQSDKEKAMKFLMEIPQEVVNSKTFTYSGINKLSKNVLEKGCSSDIEINNLKFDTLKSSTIKNMGLESLTGNISIISQTGPNLKLNNSLINITDGKNNSFYQIFNKDNEYYANIPQVFSDILFKIPNKEVKKQELLQSSVSNYQNLATDTKTLFQEIFYIINNEADVRVITGDEKGYRFDLAKNTTNKIWAKLIEYLKKQKNQFADIEWINNLFLDAQSLVRPTSSTFISITKKNKNINISIVGEMNKKSFKISFKKIDELIDDNINTKILLSTYHGSEKYLDAKYEEKIQKRDLKFTSFGSLKIKNKKINSISTKGYLKDKKIGEFITFILDDISIESSGNNIINFSSKIRLGLLTGTIKTKDDNKYSLNIDLSKISNTAKNGYLDMIRKFNEKNLSLNNGVMYDD